MKDESAAPNRMGIVGSWVMTSWHGGRYRPLVNDNARLDLGPAEGKRVLAEAIKRRAVIQCWEPSKWFTMHPEWKRAQRLVVAGGQPPQPPAIERINLMAIRWVSDGCAAEAEAYFRKADANNALGLGLSRQREAWRVADAKERDVHDGREVWPLDDVKDWTVRLLFDVGADLRKMHDAAANGRPREKRGAVRDGHHRYFYTASRIELEALRFESDLAWAADQISTEIARLAQYTTAHIKGECIAINAPKMCTVSACLESFSASGTDARGGVVFDLWCAMGLEPSPSSEDHRADAVHAASMFVARRASTYANWLREVTEHRNTCVHASKYYRQQSPPRHDLADSYDGIASSYANTIAAAQNALDRRRKRRAKRG